MNDSNEFDLLSNWTKKSTRGTPSRGGIYDNFCWFTNEAAACAYIITIVLFAFIACVENFLIMVIIYKNKSLQRPSVLLLGILAAIDFITASVLASIETMVTIKYDAYWAHTFQWIFIAVLFLSLSIVVLITLDRFCHVFFLDKYSLTPAKFFIALIFCWIAPIALVTLIALKIEIGIGGAMFAATYFFFCISTMTAAYIAMLVTLKKHTVNSLNAMRQDYMEKQWRAVNTTLIIFTTFCIMNIPPMLSIILGFMGIVSRTLCAFTFIAMISNAAVNPLIYSLRINSLRIHLTRFLGIYKFLRRDSPKQSPSGPGNGAGGKPPLPTLPPPPPEKSKKKTYKVKTNPKPPNVSKLKKDPKGPLNQLKSINQNRAKSKGSNNSILSGRGSTTSILSERGSTTSILSGRGYTNNALTGRGSTNSILSSTKAKSVYGEAPIKKRSAPNPKVSLNTDRGKVNNASRARKGSGSVYSISYA